MSLFSILTILTQDGSIGQSMILSSSKLLSMRSGTAPIVNGAVAFSRDSILAVGPSDRITKKYPGHRIVQLNNAVLMPGLINIHAHLELPPLLDTIRAKTFPEWVMNLIKAKRGLNSNDYESAARKNIETLIQTGTPTVGEICAHNVSPTCLKQSGLRAVIFHEIINMGARGKTHESSKFTVQSSKVGRSELILSG